MMQSKTKLLTHMGTALAAAILCVSCGGGGSDGGFTPTVSTPVTAPPPPVTPPVTPPANVPDEVTISGSVTFEDVPASPITNGLNFDAIIDVPVRGATIEAIDASGNILVTGQTSPTGTYSLTVPSETPVSIRVRAELVQTAGTAWDVRVQDNTSGNELYALVGSLVSSGFADSERILSADSGWGGSSYTGPRAAAPFAILAPIYETLTEFEATAPGTVFPPVAFNWSVNNISAGGGLVSDRAMGEIGTSSYVSGGPDQGIFILGEEDADTDEYDEHVIVHEWGHYFEDQLSRSDSVGGAHSLNDRLDLRLALSEGFGNAIAAIGNDDPIYRDTSGPMQSQGFFFNIESQSGISNRGYFNETSVQEIIYDVFDSADDGSDTLSLGLGPIVEAMTSDLYIGTTAFTSIYTFAEAVRAVSPASSAAINALLDGQSISGRGETGVGETEDGNISSVLPVYKVATIGGPPVVVCSSDAASNNFGSSDFNNLGTRDFIVFNNPNADVLTFRAQRISGATSVDPDFNILQQGTLVGVAQDQPSSFETLTQLTSAGDFAIEFFDFDNLDESLGVENPRADGTSCYNFTIRN